MGSWSVLSIGELTLGWKSVVPTFVAFLFSAGSEFSEIAVEPDGPRYRRAGYRSLVGDAIAALDGHGFTLPELGAIYKSFQQDAHGDALEWLCGDRLDLDASDALVEAESHMGGATLPASASAAGDLKAFVDLLRRVLASDPSLLPNDDVWRGKAGEEVFRVPRQERSVGPDDLQEIEALVFKFGSCWGSVPGAVLRPLMLFAGGFVDEHPEAAFLLYIRLLLEASDPAVVVELELGQLFEDDDALPLLQSQLERDLLRKLDVSQRLFRSLLASEADVQDRYARRKVQEALAELRVGETADEKGRALESLMSGAFDLPPQLQVIERNYRTGDEEIDLIVKNNVSRPFWQALTSPLLLVECKNWIAPVGAPEVRNFETKIRNHTSHTRVGLLVAPGGFTSEARAALARTGRESYSISLADGDDLQQLASGAESIIDWLERVLCRPI